MMTDPVDRRHDLRLECAGDLWEIRRALMRVDQFLSSHCVQRSCVEDLNLVLSEAMTNIARHGYADFPGMISLSLKLQDEALVCHLRDTGISFFPDELGHVSPAPAEFHDGGYGWFIIRSLSRKVQYSHENGENVLSFRIPHDMMT